MKNLKFYLLLVLALGGLADAAYLTHEHYLNIIPPCHINRFFTILSDCGLVLHSKYAVLFGVPLALLGAIHYFILSSAIMAALFTKKRIFKIWILIQSAGGALFSIYLMYLQFFVIKSICVYCTLSALVSFIIFILSLFWLERARKAIVIYTKAFAYQTILKPVFFLISPETIHAFMVNVGEILGNFSYVKLLIEFFLPIRSKRLEQTIAGIHFKNPIGLAAGFDYNAQLTQILPSLGFGFGSVGTITNLPYEGNPKPMLGRLPKSRSLMVNKGFKNYGAKAIIRNLHHLRFKHPVGISIGRTNTQASMTQTESVKDVVTAFNLFNSSGLNNAYYELNISCPNLYGNISFYPPKNLKELLTAVQNVRLTKPVFVKMPIEKSDVEFTKMLEVIADFKFVKGVIIGNLQKNRKDPALDPSEVTRFSVGNFSGKPCERRSNELIKLTYKKYKKRFVIIGCGGVFNGRDAYRKIKLGASLVQLITGMIYQGPTLMAQINLELLGFLKKDGYKHISEAVGTINLERS